MNKRLRHYLVSPPPRPNHHATPQTDHQGGGTEALFLQPPLEPAPHSAADILAKASDEREVVIASKFRKMRTATNHFFAWCDLPKVKHQMEFTRPEPGGAVEDKMLLAYVYMTMHREIEELNLGKDTLVDTYLPKLFL